MKTISCLFWHGLLLTAALLLNSTGPAQAQNTQLAIAQAAVVGATTSVAVGSIGYNQATADAQGNTYFAGSFVGTISFGAFSLTSTGGGSDVFVAKRDAAGTYQWAVLAGGAGEQKARALAIDAVGDVIVTGSFDSRTATFGPFTLTNAAQPTASASNDIFVAKLSGSSHTWQWAVSAGGGTRIDGDDIGTAVAVDVFGNVYVAGTFNSSVAFFGSSIQVASTYPGDANVFLAKLTAAGQWVWVKGQDYLGYEAAALSSDTYGNMYLTGSFSRRRAAFGTTVLTAVPAGSFVAKIDGAGTWLWAQSLLPSRFTRPASMNAARPDGRHSVCLAGYYVGDTLRLSTLALRNTSAFNPQGIRSGNSYVARLHADTGAWEWVVQTDGYGNEGFGTPQFDGMGHVLVAGWFGGNASLGAAVRTCAFGPSILQSAGGYDLVVAQLDTAGRWLWARQAGGSNSEGGTLYGLDAQGKGLVFGDFTDPAIQLGPFALSAYPGQSAAQSYSTWFTAQLGASGPLTVQGASMTAGFVLFPNPAHHAVTLRGLPPGQAVLVLDVLGRMVLSGTVPAQGDLHLLLPTLPKGLYMVRAGKQARRLVVE